MSNILNRKVLVLNKSWKAVGIITLERALVMLFTTCANGQPKAKVIDPESDFQTYSWDEWAKVTPKEGEDAIRTPNLSFKIPEVVLLTRYEKTPHYKIHFSRRTIFKRDGEMCMYCGCKPGIKFLTIEHILPRSRGGKTTWENCVISCQPCNSKKADRTPEECGMKLLKQPKRPTVQIFQNEVKLESWQHFIPELC